MNATEQSQFPNDFFSFDTLFTDVGAPFLIGAAVGFFAKKMLKLTLFVAGAIIVLLFIGEYQGIISISDAQLQSAAQSVANDAKLAGSFLEHRLARITSKGISAVGGFFIGFKFG